MGFLDRLLGRRPASSAPQWQGDADWRQPTAPAAPAGGGRGRTTDEQAVERYRYLLRTAPPEQIEQAHAEAFAKLTPEQRRQVLTDLGSEVPASERATSDDPRSLARMATRAEMRSPGTLERSFNRGGGMGGGYGGGYGGGMGGGMGMGGMIAGSLMTSIAGAFIGTAIADAMFDFDDSGESDTASGDEAGGDEGSGDEGGDYGDGGGDYGDAGGDYGGGDDFGGDFGGGDFGEV